MAFLQHFNDFLVHAAFFVIRKLIYFSVETDFFRVFTLVVLKAADRTVAVKQVFRAAALALCLRRDFFLAVVVMLLLFLYFFKLEHGNIGFAQNCLEKISWKIGNRLFLQMVIGPGNIFIRFELSFSAQF